jgi:hypothetical protein
MRSRMRRMTVISLCIALGALVCDCTDVIPGDSSIWDDEPQSHAPLAPPPPTGSWESVGSPDLALASVNNMAFIIGPDDTPYVFFSNFDAGGKGAVGAFVSGAWAWYGGSTGFTDGTIDYPSMAFAPSMELYVAYQDGANANRITVMLSNGGSWSVAGNKGFSDGIASYTSLAFNASNCPCVAYNDGTYGNKAIVRWYNYSNWSNYYGLTNGITNGYATYITLLRKPGGNLFISYADDTTSPAANAACVREYTSGWNDVGLFGFSDGYASFIRLAFDPVSGNPCVGYQDGGHFDKATVMGYAGGAWTAVGGAPGVSAGVAAHVSLAVNSSGTPYIAYRDIAKGDKATVLKYADGVWSSVGQPGFTQPVDGIYMAFNSTGDPFIAYRNLVNQRVNVMTFIE